MKLLNPGPVSLTPRVRNALSEVDLCHREPEFAELGREVISRLARVYAEASAAYVPVVLTGSGTAAVEAMLGILDRAIEQVIVIANGVYGDRIVAMLEAQSKPHEVVRSRGTKASISKKRLFCSKRAASARSSRCITRPRRVGSTRSPSSEKMCRAFGVPLYLDAVSSFGRETIRFDDWNLGACAATANKCLHGAPGVSFVLARRSAFESPRSAPSSVYLDLHRYEKEQRTATLPSHKRYTFSVRFARRWPSSRRPADGKRDMRDTSRSRISFASVSEGSASRPFWTRTARPS